MNSKELRQISKAGCFNIMDICPFCNSLARPRIADDFFVYSEKQEKTLKVRYEAGDHFEIGLTPHMVIFAGFLSYEFIEVYKFCSICEVEKRLIDEKFLSLRVRAADHIPEIMEINLWKELYEKRAFKGF
ncbi:MAG: hypothetical protein U0469_01045 [Candidatus Paceibacterota bacterium]|jgi:hypothetical protein